MHWGTFRGHHCRAENFVRANIPLRHASDYLQFVRLRTCSLFAFSQQLLREQGRRLPQR